MQVSVREICSLDAEALALLERACFTDAWSKEMVVATLQRRDFCGVILHLDGECVGYVLGLSLFENAEILRIAIAPDYRKRGLGAQLLDAFIALVKKRGAREIFLEVRESNLAAQRLYLSRAFEKFHLRERYYSNGENAVEMKKTL